MKITDIRVKYRSAPTPTAGTWATRVPHAEDRADADGGDRRHRRGRHRLLLRRRLARRPEGLNVVDQALILGRIRSLLVGQDPFDREMIWKWMWVANLPENVASVVDN